MPYEKQSENKGDGGLWCTSGTERKKKNQDRKPGKEGVERMVDWESKLQQSEFPPLGRLSRSSAYFMFTTFQIPPTALAGFCCNVRFFMFNQINTKPTQLLRGVIKSWLKKVKGNK